mgnify:FL=1
MEIWNLKEREEWIRRAAEWFHEKWDVPAGEYEASMRESGRGTDGVPQWYIAVEQGEIVGGVGVIEKEFHNRRDLASNVCVLYVEENFHSRGITAGALLEQVCGDMRSAGLKRLCLITNHPSVAERYGWKFLGMVQGIRMYEKEL